MGRTAAAGHRHWRRRRSAAGATRRPAFHPRNVAFLAWVLVLRGRVRPCRQFSLGGGLLGKRAFLESRLGPACCDLDATFDHCPSTVQQRLSRMAAFLRRRVLVCQRFSAVGYFSLRNTMRATATEMRCEPFE